MSIKDDGQLALDERVIEDPKLVDLLEKRLRLYDDRAEISKSFKAADTEAKDAIAAIGLGDDEALRIGRFRITRTIVAPKSVAFETEEASRIRIEVEAT